jgi:hypothetical protein
MTLVMRHKNNEPSIARLLPAMVRCFCVASLFAAPLLRADDSFTKTLSPADFAAAGLDKLTPDELARLNALIRARETGQPAPVSEEVKAQIREEAKAEVRQEVKAEVKAEVKEEVKAEVKAEVREEVKAEVQAENPKPASPGFVDRVKVLLRPGTEIQYTTLETTLLPPFHGWSNGTMFTLANGQRWIVQDDGRYWSREIDRPLKVKIVPGMIGSFFMEIERGGRPRVRFASNSIVAPGTPASPPPPPPAPSSP